MEQGRIIFDESGGVVALVLVDGFPADGRMWDGVSAELTSAGMAAISALTC